MSIRGIVLKIIALLNEKGGSGKSTLSINLASALHRRGKKVVLAFYPVGSIPYCRLEADILRNEFIKLQDLGIVVLGINTESVKEHLDFTKKWKIPFPLLTADKKLLSLFDVDGWFGEVKRKTFLINEQGVLVKIIDDVKLKKHHLQILDGFK